MATRIVWVVAFDGGVGGFDWYAVKDDAEARFPTVVGFQEPGKHVWLFPWETESEGEAVTEEIDAEWDRWGDWAHVYGGLTERAST